MTKSLKVLYLTPGCFDKGGISRYCRYQITALKACCGVQNVKTLSLLAPDENAIETKFETDWHGSSLPGSMNKFHKLKFSIIALWYTFHFNPDIIHIAHVNMGPLALILKKVSNAKVVLNVYGLEIWTDLSRQRSKAMIEIDYIISDCHFTADYVLEQNLHTTRPTVIWDPVDLGAFSVGNIDNTVCDKYHIPDPSSHQIILSLGRLAKEAAHKGYDRLITVFSLLSTDFPAARLVIAGRGNDRPRLEALGSELGVSDKIVFTGSVDEGDLAQIYRTASVFSLVSDRGHGRGEGIPLTPLEAMACGVPIIVGNEDGSQEAVFDGTNGQIVSPKNQGEHYQALARILSDKDLAQSMSLSARSIAVTHFSYKGFEMKHKKLLESISK